MEGDGMKEADLVSGVTGSAGIPSLEILLDASG